MINGRWCFAGGVQWAEGPRTNAEWNPKSDGAIGERDEHCLTPVHVERGERDGHEAFNDADARRCGRDDQKKISNGKAGDDGACCEGNFKG